MADVKFSQFANGGNLQSADIVVGLRGGVNTQFSSPASPLGPFLLKANNLSDVSNKMDSFQNLGFGSGQLVFLTDADFPAGIHVLTNPCPNFVQIQLTTPGAYILRLPPAQATTAFQISQGPIIRVNPSLSSGVTIELQDSIGTNLTGLPKPSGTHVYLSDNSTVQGTWVALPNVFSISTNGGDSGDMTLRDSFENVYVDALNGQDILNLGQGSIFQPYSTLSFALAQITDASSSKPYKIIMNTGVYTDVNIALKPWIYIDLNGSSLTVSGSITLDASWAGNSGNFSITNGTNCSFPATVTLDFNAIGATFSYFVLNNNTAITTATTWNIIAPLSGMVNALSNNFGFGNEWTYNITRSYGAIIGGATGDITISDCPFFSLIDLITIGNVLVTASDTSSLIHKGCDNTGTVTYRETGSGTLTVSSKANIYSSAPTLDNGLGGGSVKFDSDVLNVLPTLVNGASYFPTSIADAMGANHYFFPTNYTRVAGPPGQWTLSSIPGNLAGIDNALVENVIKQQLWINFTDGNDSSQGGLSSPFKSYPAATAFAALTASPTNRFLIKTIGDLTLAGDFTIRPYIDLDFQDSTVTINGGGGIVLDPSWTVSNEKVVITGFKPICAAGLNTGWASNTDENNDVTFLNGNWAQCASGFAFSSGSSNLNDNTICIINDLNPVPTSFSGGMTISDIKSKMNGVNFGGDVNYTLADDDYDIDHYLTNCYVPGAVNITRPAGNSTQRVRIRNTFIGSPINLDSQLGQVFIDSDSYSQVPVLGGFNTFADILIEDITDGVLMNTFTPVNYSFVAGNYANNALTGYLVGIDNSIGALGGRVVTVLGNTSLFQDTYPSGATTSVWQTLIGTNTILAGSLSVGQTVELTATGFLNSTAPGGTGIITFNLGALITVTSQVITRTLSVTTPVEIRARITLVNPIVISASIVGYYTDEANLIQPILMVISPFTTAYNPLVNNNITLTWTPTYIGSNKFNLILPNLNIIQYN